MENLTKNISKSEVEINYTHCLPSGHGHYKIYGEARISGSHSSLKLSFTTSNMPLIDEFKSENTESERIGEIKAAFCEDLFDKNESYINEFVLEFESED